MKNRLLSGILTMCAMYTYAQQLPNRYLEEITSNISVTKDVVFSTNIPTVTTTNLFGNYIANEESYGKATTTLKMDIYSPNNDNIAKRPVIIFAFGGGFVNGSRTEASMVQLCESFAKRGFVTATIDYRLGMNLTDVELSKRAVYRALQDGRSAVRFFRKNASTYNIDPDQIYMSGHSAGAFLAYQNVYLDKDSERPASTRNYLSRPDLGGLDEIGDNKTYSNGTLINGKANSVMGFAGALGDLNYIEKTSDVTGVYFHSSDDSTVPYNSGEPFSLLSWIPGFNLPTVYGGNQMNIKAGAVEANRTFYPYTNRGHKVHFDGSKLYTDIAPRGGQFFYDSKLKPSSVSLTGNLTVCTTCPAETYTVSNTAYYYDWQVTGGTFTSRDPYKSTVTVQWSSTATTKTLSVTPYSRQLARGNTVVINIGVNKTPVAKNSLQDVTSINNVNLNDYFEDPEGKPLQFKISSPLIQTPTIVDNGIITNDMLNTNNIDNKNTDLIIEVNDGSNCSTIKTISLKPSQIKSNIDIAVSPNPFINNINVNFDENYKGQISLQLFNANGQIVAEKNIEKATNTLSQNLTAENLNNGVYYLKIINNNNTVVKRILKN